jgi:hypothetical protein
MENLKRANLAFHFAERLKSNFLIISSMIAQEDDKLEKGKDVLQVALHALEGEINIAMKYLDSKKLELAKAEIVEAKENLRLSAYGEVRKNLSKGLSYIVTICNSSLKPLKERNLI